MLFFQQPALHHGKLFTNCITLAAMKPLLACILTAGLFFSMRLAGAQEALDTRTVTVLYTNDEHGWMEGMSPDQGAANLYQLWQEQEAYTEDGAFLLLSGGDNWTGPAISTWTQGESMVEVMNAMHYDASAVGNHEYDFGLDALTQRIAQADFPYLSANTRWKDNGKVPRDLGILPYTIINVNGLEIGIIGLTTTSTPYVTNPTYVSKLDFIDYEKAVRETMPALVGTDLQFIIAHVCMDALEPLVRNISDLGIDLAGGGHCNELVAKTLGSTVVLGGGFHFTTYARADFTIDMTSKTVSHSNLGTTRNRGANPDTGIAGIVQEWAAKSADSLNEVIGWSARSVPRGEVLDQAIINSWLKAYPDADIAITNRGGIRTALPEGKITLSDIVNILPFDNTIISVNLSGLDIAKAMEEGGRPVAAGLEQQNNRWVLTETGTPMKPEEIYTVLLNSFMYAGGDNFSAIADAAPNGFDTRVNYRQPFVDWIKSRESARNTPFTLDK